MVRSVLAACLALLMLSSAGRASDAVTPEGGEIARIPGMVLSTPKDREPPRYPAGAASRGIEGWVMMSLTVRADGTVADVNVLESSDDRGRFEAAALRAMKDWIFNPATLNGVPVEERNKVIRISFKLGTEKGARAKVIKRFRAFDEAAADKGFDEAQAILTELEEMGLNLYEWGHFYSRQGNLHEYRGEMRQALRAYERALIGDGDYLDDKAQVVVMRNVLRLELQLGHFADAVDSYDALKAHKRAPGDDDPVMKAAAELIASVDKPGAVLQVGGDLILDCRAGSACAEGQSYWRHKLHGRNVQFEAAEGRIEAVTARCTTMTATAEPIVGTVWEIPDSWGDCTLWVAGERGARITMLEF